MFLPHNGLVDSASEKAIPLDSVQVFANMIDMCLEVTLIQRYTNKEENPIEALYRFPLPKDASLCGFQAEIDGVKLNGQVMEKQSAQEKYDDAISSGQGAYLVEKEEQDLEEVFSVLVGNLPPQKTVSIIIKYVTEVSLYNNQLRFVLPTTISPLAALSIDSDNVAVVEEEEKSAVTPANSQVGAEVGNKFSIDVSIVLKSEILEVTSPSHPIEVHQPSAVANGLKSRHVSLKKGAAPQPFLDTEFVLLVKVDQVFKPRMYIETLDEASLKQSQHQHHHQHQQQQQQQQQQPEAANNNNNNNRNNNASDNNKEPDSRAVMLTFYPAFEEEPMVSEIVFLVDQSGSMSGQRIEQTKNALQFFLRSLPETCHFNIVGFGSHFTHLFPKSKPYSDESLETATNHVANLDANLGGTDILKPLKAIFAEPPSVNNYRNIFILSDGEVENRDQVLNLVSKNNENNRIFSLGIGRDVDVQLIKGLATNGNGVAEFIIEDEGNINVKVLRHLKRALKPYISKIELDWGPLASHIRQAPSELPPLMEGESIVVYGFINDSLDLEVGSGNTTTITNDQQQESAATTTSATTDVPPPSHQRKKSFMDIIASILKKSAAENSSNVVVKKPDNAIRLSITLNADRGRQIVRTFDFVMSGNNVSERGPEPVVFTSGNVVHRLAARALIKQLEKQQSESGSYPNAKDEIVRLATRYCVASKYTSFVAVEQRDVPTMGELELKKVPMFITKQQAPAPKHGPEEEKESYRRASSSIQKKGGIGLPIVSMLLKSSSSSKSKSKSQSLAPPAARRCDKLAYAGMDMMMEKEEEEDDDDDGEYEAQAEEAPVAPSTVMDCLAAPPLPLPEAPVFALPPPPPPAPMPSSAPAAAPATATSIASTTATPKKRTKFTKDTLKRFVMLQKASGSWKLSDELCQLLDLATSEVEQRLSSITISELSALAADKDLRESVWATAIVLAVFEQCFKSQKGDWEMVHSKAMKWLEKTIITTGSVMNVLQQAKTYLKEANVF